MYLSIQNSTNLYIVIHLVLLMIWEWCRELLGREGWGPWWGIHPRTCAHNPSENRHSCSCTRMLRFPRLLSAQPSSPNQPCPCKPEILEGTLNICFIFFYTHTKIFVKLENCAYFIHIYSLRKVPSPQKYLKKYLLNEWMNEWIKNIKERYSQRVLWLRILFRYWHSTIINWKISTFIKEHEFPWFSNFRASDFLTKNISKYENI